jgi:hypothetical protein
MALANNKEVDIEINAKETKYIHRICRCIIKRFDVTSANKGYENVFQIFTDGCGILRINHFIIILIYSLTLL